VTNYVDATLVQVTTCCLTALIDHNLSNVHGRVFASFRRYCHVK